MCEFTVVGCRGEALKVVMDFTANAGLLQVAQLLYQLEVMLLQSSLSPTKVSCTCSHVGQSHHKLQSHIPSEGSYILSRRSDIWPSTMDCPLISKRLHRLITNSTTQINHAY